MQNWWGFWIPKWHRSLSGQPLRTCWYSWIKGSCVNCWDGGHLIVAGGEDMVSVQDIPTHFYVENSCSWNVIKHLGRVWRANRYQIETMAGAICPLTEFDSYISWTSFMWLLLKKWGNCPLRCVLLILLNLFLLTIHVVAWCLHVKLALKNIKYGAVTLYS